MTFEPPPARRHPDFASSATREASRVSIPMRSLFDASHILELALPGMGGHAWITLMLAGTEAVGAAHD